MYFICISVCSVTGKLYGKEGRERGRPCEKMTRKAGWGKSTELGLYPIKKRELLQTKSNWHCTFKMFNF